MTPESLANELRQATRRLEPCKCGSATVMLYEPGCTRVVCQAERRTLLAGPDWCPIELTKTWNND